MLHTCLFCRSVFNGYVIKLGISLRHIQRILINLYALRGNWELLRGK